MEFYRIDLPSDMSFVDGGLGASLENYPAKWGSPGLEVPAEGDPQLVWVSFEGVHMVKLSVDIPLINYFETTSENTEMTYIEGKNVAAYTIAELKTLAQQGDHGTQTAVGTELLNRLLQGKFDEPNLRNHFFTGSFRPLAELRALAGSYPASYTEQDLAVAWELFDMLVEGKLYSEPVIKTGLIHCYSIQEWDGGENHNHVFYLTNETEANRYLADPKHKHNQAIPCVLKIFDSVAQSLEFSPKAIKERALAKLTEEEKFILNLKY